MVDPAARAFLETIEYRLADGEQVEVEVSLTLLAAGGDPRRELDPEGRAVSALATDL